MREAQRQAMMKGATENQLYSEQGVCYRTYLHPCGRKPVCLS